MAPECSSLPTRQAGPQIPRGRRQRPPLTVDFGPFRQSYIKSFGGRISVRPGVHVQRLDRVVIKVLVRATGPLDRAMARRGLERLPVRIDLRIGPRSSEMVALISSSGLSQTGQDRRAPVVLNLASHPTIRAAGGRLFANGGQIKGGGSLSMLPRRTKGSRQAPRAALAVSRR